MLEYMVQGCSGAGFPHFFQVAPLPTSVRVPQPFFRVGKVVHVFETKYLFFDLQDISMVKWL